MVRHDKSFYKNNKTLIYIFIHLSLHITGPPAPLKSVYSTLIQEKVMVSKLFLRGGGGEGRITKENPSFLSNTTFYATMRRFLSFFFFSNC